MVGELGGVGEQVEQRLPDLGLVGVHRADVVGALDHQRVAVLLDQRLDDRLDVPDELADLERLQEQVHPAGLDLGEVQDVVDQPEQVLAGRVDPLEVREERLLVEVLGLLLEHLGVADDGVQRRPQLVAHVRQELRLVLAGLGKLAVRLLELLEEPGVLDGDDGLVGERLQQGDLLAR